MIGHLGGIGEQARVRRCRTRRGWKLRVYHERDGQQNRIIRLGGRRWAKFRDSNQVQIGDDLELIYHGESIFTVRVMDNGAEKFIPDVEVGAAQTVTGRRPSWISSDDHSLAAQHYTKHSPNPWFAVLINKVYKNSGTAVSNLSIYLFIFHKQVY